MIRILLVCVLICGAYGQSVAPSDPLVSLEQTAKQRAAAWQRLAENLEPNIARLLPCDAKIAATISEAGRASEERLAALSAYLNAASQEAARDTDATRRAVTAVQALASSLADEKSDVTMEEAAVEAELANLAESVKQRSSLEDAHKALQQIAALAKQRSELAQSASKNYDALLGTLRGLADEFGNRQEALKSAAVTYEAERARWNSYYASRLARAQTECAIVKGTPAAAAPSAPAAAPRRPQGKKRP